MNSESTSTPTTTRSGLGASSLATFLSVVWPGAGHLYLRTKFRAAVIAVAAVNVVATIVAVVILAPAGDRSGVADIVADRPRFIALGIALLVLALARLLAAIDTAWIARPTGTAANTGVRYGATAIAAVLIIGGVAPIVVLADYIRQTDSAVEKVFGNEEPDVVMPATTSTTTVGTTTTSLEPTTTTEPPIFPGVDRVNILLLGGDAGPDRYGLRTDSMVVISIDPATGDTAMISVPRNIGNIPFPAGTPLADEFPNGFPDLANAVYHYGEGHPDMVPGADNPGAIAIKQAIAQLLGIPLQYYVLVDMAGFVNVVDAIGGIDINILKRVPTVGVAHDKYTYPPYHETGEQHLDGHMALSYARTRSADSDYQRMGRQRCVLGAIAEAATPRAVASGLSDLINAFGESVRTDIPRSALGDMSKLVDRYAEASGTDKVRTLHLAPPWIPAVGWDLLQIHDLVRLTLDPATKLDDLEGDHSLDFLGDLGDADTLDDLSFAPLLADTCK